MTTAISNSEMNDWKRCPRKWFITYYLGYVPAASSPVGNAQLGIWVHTALEGMYGHNLDPLYVLTLIYQRDLDEHPEYHEELGKQFELARTMIEGYLEWIDIESKDAGITVVAVERDLRVPLPLARFADVELRCRLDQQVVDIATGFRRFLDHKTAAGFEAHHLLQLNPQFKTYAVAQHLDTGTAIGERPVPGQPIAIGGYINTLRRVKRTPRMKLAAYQRDPVEFDPETLLSHYQSILGVCSEIMEARQSLDWCYTVAGGDLDAINMFQRFKLRPVQIASDCDWRCPLSKGLCVAMDDGTDWGGMLRSGAWEQGDPYRYHEHNSIADLLPGGPGSLSTGR